MENEETSEVETVESPQEKLVWTAPVLAIVAEARSAMLSGGYSADGLYSS